VIFKDHGRYERKQACQPGEYANFVDGDPTVSAVLPALRDRRRCPRDDLVHSGNFEECPCDQLRDVEREGGTVESKH